jgi:hypothetical protein
VKGELMDELEDSFYFFVNCQIPRLWRDNAIGGFVNMVADNLRKIDDFMTALQKQPRYTNYDRKRKREEETVSSPTKRPNKETTPKALLAFTKFMIHDADDEEKLLCVFLRDIIAEGMPVLDNKYNLATEYVIERFCIYIPLMLTYLRCISYTMLRTTMHWSTKISYDRDRHALYYRKDIFLMRIQDSDSLRQAIRALHDRSGIINLVYRNKPQTELDELAAREQAELEKQSEGQGQVNGSGDENEEQVNE